MDTKVVVTGMGVVSPLGNDVPTYWKALCEGRSGIRTVECDTENIPSKIAGIAQDVVPEGMGPKDVRRQNCQFCGRRIDRVRQRFDIPTQSCVLTHVTTSIDLIGRGVPIDLRELALDWHFIGPLQSNKTAAVAQVFSWVHGMRTVRCWAA